MIDVFFDIFAQIVDADAKKNLLKYPLFNNYS